jgi:hypothetical protein
MVDALLKDSVEFTEMMLVSNNGWNGSPAIVVKAGDHMDMIHRGFRGSRDNTHPKGVAYLERSHKVRESPFG